MMEPSLIYGLSLAFLIFLFTLRPIALCLGAIFGHSYKKHIQYPLLVTRNRYTGSVSRLEAIYLVIYLAINGVVIGYSIRDRSDLSRRTALASLVNIVPLCFGGRTNPLMNFIGIPLPLYHYAHHWFGRVAIIEASIHACISLLPPQPSHLLITSGCCGGLPPVDWLIRVLTRLQGRLFVLGHRDRIIMHFSPHAS